MIDFDAVSTINDVNFKGGQTWAHVCATDATLLLIVFNHNTGGPIAGDLTAVTYAGNACTKLTNIKVTDAVTNDGINVEVWYIYGPAAGNNNIIATSGAVVDAYGGAVASSYVGTRGEDAFGATSSNSTGAGASISTSVTGYNDGLVLAAGGKEGALALVTPAEQTERGTAAWGLGGGWNCRVTSSDKRGAGTVTVSYSHADGLALAIIAVPIRPAETGRRRGVSYTFDIWDPEQKILNEQGRNVPPWEIKRDRWIRVTGLLLPSSEAYDSFADDPEVAYIESVTYDDAADSLSIKTSRGELGEVILARAAGRKTL